MKLVLITYVFPPMRSSGAVQMRDLAIELRQQGHEVTVIYSDPDLKSDWKIDLIEGVEVLRLRTMPIRDRNYAVRTLAEFLMPFLMKKALQKSPFKDKVWDGIVWYSPSIFFGPLVKFLKARCRCKSYLILRDIFPAWAVDMKLIRKGVIYQLFRCVEKFQYQQADTIGVQSPGNLSYFRTTSTKPNHHGVEVLHNWLSVNPPKPASIELNHLALNNRVVAVYAGNMGVAQNAEIFVHLAMLLREDPRFGFLFIGRGSSAESIRQLIAKEQLNNALFFDEVDPEEIPSIYAQCNIGLLALDPRHKSHNIPGKFVSYLSCGLPVLARVNPNNDLISLIEQESVGVSYCGDSVEELRNTLLGLYEQVKNDKGMPVRCQQTFRNYFSSTAVAQQIVNAL